MPTPTEQHRALTGAVHQAQGNLDRVRRWAERTTRYYDEAPDGDPRKAEAERTLERISRSRLQAEADANRAVDALLAFEDAHPEVTA